MSTGTRPAPFIQPYCRTQCPSLPTFQTLTLGSPANSVQVRYPKPFPAMPRHTPRAKTPLPAPWLFTLGI